MLGSCDVRGADGRVREAMLSQPRRLALLVYLAASEREYHSRSSVARLFWPNASEVHARGALKQAVFAIRRTLGADVISTRGSSELGINERVLECDVRLFRRAIREARFQDAAALYTGDFLEFHEVAGEPAFKSWVAAERTRLAEDYHAAYAAVVEIPPADIRAEHDHSASEAVASAEATPQSNVAHGTPRGTARARRRVKSAATMLAAVVAVASIAGAVRRS